MKKVFYLGPEGSYSHIITKNTCGAGDELIACNSFTDIVKNTLTNKATIGVLPIENSITSSVHENMDYLFKEKLNIVGEAYLKINLYLIGFKNVSVTDVKKVYSQPKALAQCKEYISMRNFTTQDTASTAAAKDMILKINDKRVAVIGSKELAYDSKLTILDENIGDNKYNFTRFVFVSNKRLESSKEIKNKTSVMFTVPHKSGTLAKILTVFTDAKFNLTKIESRPIPGTKWEYQFWVDIEEEKKAINEKQLQRILDNNSSTYKIIGIYQKGEIFES